MKNWLTSRTGALGLTALITIGVCLVPLSAITSQGLSARTLTASLLVLCFVVFVFGGVLFSGRAFLKWPGSETPAYLTVERGFIIAALLITVLGLALLEDLQRAAGEQVLSRLGTVAFLVGAVIVLAAETSYLGKRDWNYAQIVLYVVVAFLAQAALGASLLQTGLVAGWAGWATIIWNVVWLFVMLIFSRRNMYFPVLHHVAPLIIGFALLVG